MLAVSHFRECLGSRKPPCPRSHSIRAARPGGNGSLVNPNCTCNPDLSLAVVTDWDAAFPRPSQVCRGIVCGCEHEHIYKSNYSHICNRLKYGTTKDIHTLTLQAVNATQFKCYIQLKGRNNRRRRDFIVVQSLSRVRLCDPMDRSTPGLPALHHLPEFAQFMPIKSMMPSNHLVLCHPLLLPPSIFPSIRVFPSESALHIRWPKDWSFSFSISPSNEYSWLISFRMDWFDLLAVKGTLKILSQCHSSKASILRCSVFLIVQLSHLYMTTGKTMALTVWTFVGKIMSLLFNMLSRFVKAFLPRSKRLLISGLHSSSIVILEPKKIVCHCFHCFPIYLPWSDGTECHDLCFLNVEL